MDRALYIAMSGARQALAEHAAQSHNLANMNTVGFRADLLDATSLPVHGPGYPDRAYAQYQTHPVPDLTPGPLIATGRSLDIAIQGQGFWVVQASDGNQAYSRAGDLKLSAAGLLTDASGRPILGEGGPIALPPHNHLEIGGDGTVSIRPAGQTQGPLATVDRIFLAKPNPAELIKANDGTIRHRDGAPAVADGSVRVLSGSIETSNVQPIQAMVRMIEIQRQFETHVRMMDTTEENDQAAARLLRLRS